MTSSYVAQVIADERRAELERRACLALLVEAARCCVPTAWQRAARRATAVLARLRPTRSTGPVCCATT